MPALLLLHSLILPPPPILLLTPTPFLALSGYWLYFLLAIAFSVSSLISFSLASSPFPPPSQAAPENILIRARVKSSERVYFPDEIKQHNSWSSPLHFLPSAATHRSLSILPTLSLLFQQQQYFPLGQRRQKVHILPNSLSSMHFIHCSYNIYCL